MILTEDYDLQDLIGLSSILLPVPLNIGVNSHAFLHKIILAFEFLLPVTSNMGSPVNKGELSLNCPIYYQKVSIPMFFCPKITIFESL